MLLPAPVTFQRRGLVSLSHSPRSLPKILRAPARLTNFSALLLIALASCSVLLHLRLYFQNHNVPPPRSVLDTLPERPPSVSDLDHLVIVPGHAIWIGALAQDAEVEDSWLLASYQRARRRPSIFRAHIARGAQIATEDPRALLVFSGGFTSPYSATSEGESYLRFARATGILPSIDVFSRVTTEDASLDSFQNLLFSIARFREITGAYPTRITVVSHRFKHYRFERLHRLALRWPKHRFIYEGIPLGNEADEHEAASGELANAYTPYSVDLYGCHAPLTQKRAGRNFHMRSHGYHVGAPELRELFEWCPKDGIKIFPGTLPWGK
ncbi:hypothetical protein F5148DRAFT_1010229 [Russula earlei]|uniref:Uncharacterized protein n=1 Tax=Russula earlei TaxID=71964 RepID=A0ACC0UH05_9AGAM|nr:hypothetical protein F5148DRAFT_1010229 [Russula earlei]